jgi:catechol 2,3-dioxygenase-like lactoylglutathione lyase family enzyme
MASLAVAVLGVAVAVVGPVLVMTIGLRSGGRDFVYGTAHVHEVSAMPADGAVGRCELEVVVQAKGMNGVPVRVRDHAVPVGKWPEIGQILPVMVGIREPRHVRVLWDEIPAHRIPSDGPSSGDNAEPDHDGRPDPDERGYDDGDFDSSDLDGDGIDPLFGFGTPPAETPESADLPLECPEEPQQDPHALPESADDLPTQADGERKASSTAVLDSPPVPRARRPQEDPAPEVVADEAVAPNTPAVTGAASSHPAEEAVDVGLPESPIGATNANGVSVTLIVSDLARSCSFYRDTLGLQEIDTSRSSAVLAFGEARVILRQVTDMPPIDRRLVHLNLDVPDVQEAYDRMRERGVEFVHRPRVVQQGEHLELCSATFRDPDGHAIALTRWAVRH